MVKIVRLESRTRHQAADHANVQLTPLFPRTRAPVPRYDSCYALLEASMGSRGQDKQQDALADEGRDTPEGLKRPRKGPIDKNVGRTYEEAAKDAERQPQSPGQPAGGE
jgi:hypothetical protein